MDYAETSSPGYTSTSSSSRTQSGGGKDELSKQFERSVIIVRDYTSRFERDIGRPALKLGGEMFDERPITATFLAILSMLSIFPILSFLGVAAFTIVSLLSIAVIAALSVSFAVVFGLFAVLVAIMIASVCTSAFLTVGALFTYLFARLVMLVRKKGVSAGISEWSDALWSRVAYMIAKERSLAVDDSRSDATNESAVLVPDFGHRSPDNHDESFSSDSDIKVQG